MMTNRTSNEFADLKIAVTRDKSSAKTNATEVNGWFLLTFLLGQRFLLIVKKQNVDGKNNFWHYL